MVKVLCIGFLFVYGLSLKAQVQEDFSDPDLQDFPFWTGTLDKFSVNGGLLQAQGQGTDTIWLSTFISDTGELELNCWLRMGFNPSSSNYVRLYLNADTSCLSCPLNGYYIQVGGSTGTTDSISLYYSSGKQKTKIAAGRAGTVGKTNNEIRIRLRRTAGNYFTLETDTQGGFAFQQEAQGQGPVAWRKGYCGLMVAHTSSNANKTWWGAVYAGAWKVDTLPPYLLKSKSISASVLNFDFSEPIDTSELSIQLYSTGAFLQWEWDPLFPKRIVVRLNAALPEPDTIQTLWHHLKDQAGNEANNMLYQIRVHWPRYQDLVFTELFVDPSPSYGLPLYEMLECYNAGTDTLELGGWRLSDGQGNTLLPDFAIAPGSYLILCDPVALPDWSNWGNTLGVPSFPSLLNTGEPLAIYNAAGVLIDTLHYRDYWHSDTDKRQGGYTLERKWLKDACLKASNWASSLDNTGGTPGKINSKFLGIEDTDSIFVIEVRVIDSVSIRIILNKPGLLQSGLTRVIRDQQLINVQLKISGDTIWLEQLPVMQNDLLYDWELQHLGNCHGPSFPSTRFSSRWIRSWTPLPGDLLITELMPDPASNGPLPDAEWVELYNNSSHLLQLEGLSLQIGSRDKVVLKAQLLQPGETLLLIPPGQSASFFRYGKHQEVPFSLRNDGDFIILSTTAYCVHQVIYRADQWKDGMNGVSLELFENQNYCRLTDAWSSSSNVEGGSPGDWHNTGAFSPFQRQIWLDKIIDKKTLRLKTNFWWDSLFWNPSLELVLHPGSQQLVLCTQGPVPGELLLSWNNDLEAGISYKLILKHIPGCATGQELTVEFQMPEQPVSGDWALNEVLFDPYSVDPDFIELVNISNKVLDVAALHFQINRGVTFIDRCVLVYPGQYIVLTPLPDRIRSRYKTRDSGSIIRFSGLPSLPDEQGTLIIKDTLGQLLLTFHYHKNWHFDMLDDPEGVSLERINLDVEMQSPDNWHSASYTCGGATPGYENSQSTKLAADHVLKVQPEVFSPDQDGNDDFAMIVFQTDVSGWMGTLKIYDPTGIEVRRLLNNQLIGNTTTLKWDGCDDIGKLLSSGVYLIVLEAYHLGSGHSKSERQPVVLYR